jgi:pilus assembly protein Flp/PilA
LTSNESALGFQCTGNRNCENLLREWFRDHSCVPFETDFHPNKNDSRAVKGGASDCCRRVQTSQDASQTPKIIAKQFRRSSFQSPSTADEGAAITNGQSHFVYGLSCFRPPQSYGRGRPREWRILMKTLALKVQRFLTSEDGPTAVEYAVMLALIVIVCLTAIQQIGTNATATFNRVSTQLSS